MIIYGNLQPRANLSSHSDRPVEVTPSGVVSHKTSVIDRPDDLPAVVESVEHQHALDTGGSDTSVSSREQTDASSVDSLDLSSAEKPGPKAPPRRSRKNPIVAMCHKRKSVTPLGTHADAATAFNKSPEARRSSAPYNRPFSMKLNLPVETECPPSKSPTQQKQLLHKTAAASDKSPEGARRISDPVNRPSSSKLQPPVQAECLPPSKSPVQQKRLLHACKSDGDATSPTENDESQLCGQQPHSAASCGTDGALDEVDSETREAPQTAPVLLHKTDGAKLMLKMNRKIRSALRFTTKTSSDQPHPVDSGEDIKVRVVDLSSENVPVTPSVLTMTYSELMQRGRSSQWVACLTNRLLLATFTLQLAAEFLSTGLSFVTVSQLTVCCHFRQS